MLDLDADGHLDDSKKRQVCLTRVGGIVLESVTIWVAFWAGFASFISPCCLPLYPSFISYITGISVSELKSGQAKSAVRLVTFWHTLSFILGFSIIFFALGATAGVVGDLFADYRDLIRQLAAILIFVMGLFLIGFFQPAWLMKERKLNVGMRRAGYLGSILVGIGFAAGWSPCVGPILSSILALSAAQPGAWLQMTIAYSLGFAIPFFGLSFSIGSSKWLLRYSPIMMKVGGTVMIVIAVLLYTGQLTQITNWLNAITPAWLKF